MNKLSIYSTFVFATALMIASSLLFPTDILAQVNALPIDGGYRFKPETKFLPYTRATPTNVTSNNFSQPDYCTTPDMDTAEFKQLPWYGDEQYLNNLLDSVGYPSPCPTCRVEVGVRYRIPMVFWVYNNSAGTDGGIPGDDDIRDVLDRVNEDHRRSDTGFRFYLPCDGIRRINSDNLVEISKFESGTASELRRILPNSNFVKGAINIHVVRNNVRFYNPLVDAIFVIRNRITDPNRRSTITHEIGHALGLEHTHLNDGYRGIPFANRRFVEPVDHSRRRISLNPFNFGRVRICSETGDALCDTPADPRLRESNNYREATRPVPNCVYTGNQTDPWGDRYNNPPAGSQPPNPENIMSYGRSCRVRFTRQQIGVMVHRVERGRYRFFKDGYKTNAVVFDIFEPDNTLEVADDIALNTTQLRTFNLSYRKDRAIGNEYNTGQNRLVSCDVDWVWFRVTTPGFIRIETSNSGVANVTDANTELRLFETAGGNATEVGALGNILFINDNGGAGNFSRIERNLPAGNYAIEVVNRSPNVNGYYTLEVSTCPNLSTLSVTGSATVCGSATYQANNTAGQPVRWRTSSNLTITSGQNTTSVQVSSSGGDGPGWVEAVASTGICEETERLNVATGTTIPPPAGITLSGSRLSLVSPQAGVTYTWEVSGENVRITSGQGSSSIRINLGGSCSSIFVRVSFSNGCSGTSTISRTFGNPCNNFTISPNPADEMLTVELVPQESSVAEAQSNTNTTSDAFEINLYDQGQQMIANSTSQDRQAQLDVSGFKTGIYVLHVLYQGETYPYSVVIE